jgi:hypothetical protein
MSDTVAVAADTASAAPTCDPVEAEGDPFGSKTTTTLSQNAARNRNIMTLPFVRARLIFFAAFDPNLADRLEKAVGNEPMFLPIFEANKPHIFGKFEIPAFA